MFKNAIIYRTERSQPLDFSHLPAFVECGATQQESRGFVPPRGHEHGALVETVGHEKILKLQTETRVLPADAVRRKVQEITRRMEQQTGRKQSKKELKEVKEEAILELLPQCLTRRSAINIWFSPTTDMLVIDTTSQGKADDIISLLVKCVPGLSVQIPHSPKSPSALMRQYLLLGVDGYFAVDREVEMHAIDETKAVVKYNRHTLDIDEVRSHLESGKAPVRLALTWKDRVSFVLTDTLRLCKLQFLDIVFDGKKADTKDELFDSDVAIATGELKILIADLRDELDAEEDEFGLGI